MARGVVKPRHGSRLRGRQEGGRHCWERFAAIGAHVGVLEDTSFGGGPRALARVSICLGLAANPGGRLVGGDD